MAAGLAAAIRTANPKATVTIKPGGKGDFIVNADGKLLWDKRRRDDGAFPEHDHILRELAAR